MGDLPIHPPKGQRKALDRQWLTKLHREGGGARAAGISTRPTTLKLAVSQFNRGHYWQCHETLEEIWMSEVYPLRLFYHGLIKAAVGLLHLERHNNLGASLKLRDAEFTLSPFTPNMLGIDIAKLLDDIRQRLELIDSGINPIQDAVDALPPVQISDLDPN